MLLCKGTPNWHERQGTSQSIWVYCRWSSRNSVKMPWIYKLINLIFQTLFYITSVRIGDGHWKWKLPQLHTPLLARTSAHIWCVLICPSAHFNSGQTAIIGLFVGWMQKNAGTYRLGTDILPAGALGIWPRKSELGVYKKTGCDSWKFKKEAFLF